MINTYQPVAIDVPKEGGAITPGGRIEVEEERIHAVRRQAQSPDVVPQGQLHGGRVHLLGRVPTHCKNTTEDVFEVNEWQEVRLSLELSSDKKGHLKS